MDNLRGFEPFGSDLDADLPAYALFEDEDAAIEPPPIISGDDRRMQVRALNFWTSQLHDKNFPSIEELEPSAIEISGTTAFFSILPRESKIRPLTILAINCAPNAA